MIFFVVNFMILGMYIFIIIIILHILSCFIGLRWRWEINKIKVTKYSWVLVSLGFLQLNIRHFFVKNFPAVSSSKGNKYFTLPQSCFNLTLPKGPCELLPSLVVSPYPKGHVSYCHHLLSHHTQRAMWAIAILLSHPTQRVMWTIAITCCLTVPKGPWELLPSLVVTPYPKDHVNYCHHLLSHPTQRAMWTIAIICCLTLPKGSCELLPSLVVSPYPKGHVSYCHHLFFHPTQRAMWTIVITCLTLPKGPCELLPSLVVSPYQVIVVIIKLQ